MDLFEAIFLGVIQGVTEFLPVSSDGHLLLVPSLLGMAEPDLNLVAFAHVGTLLAILVYFRRDLWQITVAVLDGLRRRQPLATTNARLGWYIAVGSIPAAIVGLLFKDLFEEIFSRPALAAIFLICMAAILVAGERLHSGHKSLEQMNWLDAILIGLAQTLALLPGISRSGMTITTGLGRGLDRPAAARYGFLLGVPAIAGAGLLALLELAQAPDLTGQLPALAATFLASAVVGYACISFLLSWLRRHSLYGFALYCAAFGLFYLLVAVVV
ncbi:MAG: undecaprenyl-diphosphatase UppP [Chloroflexi bacterium]|nr:undecaprenyl-diphosphatase UppP [Chloroflexota bacterium]MCI0577963.1 undecaprenyl-diphosphatase UppP [Chloroflexota bacterium]MCI0649273.1 undecaprenyl-diphosphatase UppP [Chloroflexota bacterium]MCI0729466.1 undecaprenyl-diphosphatase UppP [Chloroflexota bacterium]